MKHAVSKTVVVKVEMNIDDVFNIAQALKGYYGSADADYQYFRDLHQEMHK